MSCAQCSCSQPRWTLVIFCAANRDERLRAAVHLVSQTYGRHRVWFITLVCIILNLGENWEGRTVSSVGQHLSVPCKDL